MTFTVWERVLLLALIALTVALFVRDLTPKIRHIRAGKPDRVRTDRIGARLLRVLREVVFQSRVVGGRPVVGLMHAAVFLGFVAFGLETLDHFGEPFGVPVVAHRLRRRRAAVQARRSPSSRCWSPSPSSVSPSAVSRWSSPRPTPSRTAPGWWRR